MAGSWVEDRLVGCLWRRLNKTDKRRVEELTGCSIDATFNNPGGDACDTRGGNSSRLLDIENEASS